MIGESDIVAEDGIADGALLQTAVHVAAAATGSSAGCHSGTVVCAHFLCWILAGVLIVVRCIF